MDRPWTWEPARVKNYLTVVVCGILFATASSAQAFGKQTTAELQDQAITVEARAIPHFEKAMPDKTRFGKLEWRGGLIVSSPSSFFGGWSGLTIDSDGGRLLAISDTGVWLTGRLAYEGTRPTGIVEARACRNRTRGSPRPRASDWACASHGPSVTIGVRRDSHSTAASPRNMRPRISEAPASQTKNASVGHDGSVNLAAA